MTKYQWVKGITSAIPESCYHYYMNDFDDYPLDKVIVTLKKMKRWAKTKHDIDFNDIIIMGGDLENSYRCVSYTSLTFNQLVECVAICDHIDAVWLRWIILRREATIRLSNKIDREDAIKVVSIIKGKSSKIPYKIDEVLYKTVVSKEPEVI